MPTDLYEQFGVAPVNSQPAAEPRDLFAGMEQPTPTLPSMVEKYTTEDSGFNEDEKKLIGQLFTEDELKEIQSQEPIGFMEALKGKGWSHMIPYYSSGTDIAEGAVDLSMINKAKDGDPAAVSYVRDMLKKELKDQMRGTTIMGKIGTITHAAPSFIGEMVGAAFTLGAGAAPKAGAIATQGAIKAGKTAMTKQLLKKGGKSILTTALIPQLAPNMYLDRKIAGSVEITDKGEVMLKDMEENPALTAIKAFGDAWVEVASEMSGEKIVSIGGKLLTPAKKAVSPVFSKLNSAMPVKLKDNLFKAIRKVNPDAKISKMLSDKVYFNGILGEMGEERLGDVMRTTLGLDESNKSTADKYMDALFPDKDQLLAELGAFSMMGVASHASVRAYNGLVARGFSDYQARATLENMTELEKEDMANKIGIGSQETIKTEEIPLEKIKLSKEIPNFKEGVNENGVVAGEQLQGKYDRLGTAPIVLWERNNGDLEVITGRHRLDLAKRTGEKQSLLRLLKKAKASRLNKHIFLT